MRKVISLLALTLLAGCSTVKLADEYGSNTAAVIFGCPGKSWVSEDTTEKYCLMRSVKNPDEYLIAEDTGEAYGDAFLAGLTLGISLLFDDDIQEKWLKAAREYAHKNYGEGARVINFRGNRGQYKGYSFEVLKPPASSQ